MLQGCLEYYQEISQTVFLSIGIVMVMGSAFVVSI